MDNKIDTAGVAELLAKSTGKSSEELSKFLKEFADIVREHIISDRLVQVKSIGKFKVILIENRESIDVNTKARILIPEHHKLSFIPDKEMRETVNKPFSFFESIEIGDGADTATMSYDDSAPVDVDDPDVDVETEEEPDTFTVAGQTGNEPAQEIIPANEVAAARVQNDEVLKLDVNNETKTNKNMGDYKTNDNSGNSAYNTGRDRKKSEDGGSSAVVFILAAVVVILIISVATLLFLKKDTLFGDDDQKELVNAMPLESEEPIVAADTLAATESNGFQMPDNNALDEDIAAEVVTPPAKPAKQTKARRSTAPARAKYVPQTNVTVQPGDRLNLLALRYYGNKVFWVYIYQANRSVLTNPDIIPVGVNIIIPSSTAYDINARSASSVRRAYALQSEILSQVRYSSGYNMPGSNYNPQGQYIYNEPQSQYSTNGSIIYGQPATGNVDNTYNAYGQTGTVSPDGYVYGTSAGSSSGGDGFIYGTPSTSIGTGTVATPVRSGSNATTTQSQAVEEDFDDTFIDEDDDLLNGNDLQFNQSRAAGSNRSGGTMQRGSLSGKTQ